MIGKTTGHGRFKIIAKLGEGSFSEVWKALDLEQGDSEVALKIDRVEKDDSMLWKEYKVYMWLHSADDGEFSGIPKPIYYEEIEGGNLMAMPLMGPSLDVLFLKLKERFSFKTVLLILIHISKPLQFLHQHKFIHRDLKPGNIATAFSNKDPCRLYLLDFGLSARFIQPNDKPVEYKTNLKFIGTCRYCALDAHKGNSQSSASDLESLIYIMVYFLRGTLPWKGKKKQTASLKESWIPPPEWAYLWKMSKSIEYGELVDWSQVTSWAQQMMEELAYSDDGLFDWELN